MMLFSDSIFIHIFFLKFLFIITFFFYFLNFKKIKNLDINHIILKINKETSHKSNYFDTFIYINK